MDKKKYNIIYIDIPKEKIFAYEDDVSGSFHGLEGYDFLETVLLMLNSLLEDDIYTKSSFIESVILDFDENRITVKRQTKMAPTEDVYNIDYLSMRFHEYAEENSEINEDEEIEKIYQIIRYKNETSQHLLESFFLKKKTLNRLYFNLGRIGEDLKQKLKAVGRQKEFTNFEELVDAMNIKEIIEMYACITEDNIEDFIRANTYEAANAIQLIDMIINQLSDVITMMQIKIELLDEEANQDSTNLLS